MAPENSWPERTLAEQHVYLAMTAKVLAAFIARPAAREGSKRAPADVPAGADAHHGAQIGRCGVGGARH